EAAVRRLRASAGADAGVAGAAASAAGSPPRGGRGRARPLPAVVRAPRLPAPGADPEPLVPTGGRAGVAARVDPGRVPVVSAELRESARGAGGAAAPRGALPGRAPPPVPARGLPGPVRRVARDPEQEPPLHAAAPAGGLAHRRRGGGGARAPSRPGPRGRRARDRRPAGRRDHLRGGASRRVTEQFAADPLLTAAFPAIDRYPLPDGSLATLRVRRPAPVTQIGPAALAGRIQAGAAALLAEFVADGRELRVGLDWDAAGLARGWIRRVTVSAASARVGELRRPGAPTLRLEDVRVVLEGLTVNPARVA